MAKSHGPDPVLYERAGGVALITLNRPDRRNAFDGPMAHRLAEICTEVESDRTVGAVVVRGAGGSFCAGADRSLLAAAGKDPTREDNYELLGGVYEAFFRVGSLPVPVVAAVRGAAVGAGLNLVLAADLRIVADDVRLIAGFMRIGLHPGGGNFKLSTRLAGREATAALSLFGEELNGRRAREVGLAWESVPDGDVEDRAHEFAERAAADPALARMATRSFRSLTDCGPDWRVALETERAAQMWSLRRRETEPPSTAKKRNTG